MAGSKEKVSYCGLYCGLCSTCNRLPRQADALRQSMRKDGWENWGASIPNFTEFWAMLNQLSDSGESTCCRSGCGAPFCGIRKCAKKKGIEACPFCAEYPCHRIEELAKGYGLLQADAKRMKAIGLETWIEEQEERRKTGFCYTDIRCNPYSVPEE